MHSLVTALCSCPDDDIVAPVVKSARAVHMCAQVIRALLFVMFWPWLKRWGYGMSVREAAVLTW